MKTYEELKSMTTEDLVRYAMELQEKAETAEKEKQTWYKSWMEQSNKYEALKESISSIAKLS